MSSVATTPLTLNPNHLPQHPLYQPKEGTADTAIGWNLATEPFKLNPATQDILSTLGDALWNYQLACEHLYTQSLKGKSHPWIAEWVNRGKPEHLIKYGTMKRFKHQFPLVMRPDLLLTDNGLKLTELDSVPGGIGFTAALNHAYHHSGFSVVQADGTQNQNSMPLAFWNMLVAFYNAHQKQTDLNNPNTSPTTALLVSDEFSDYELEITWLVNHLQQEFNKPIHIVRPKDLHLNKDRLVYTNAEGTEYPIDLLYRFFELFDLPNIPNIELVQFAIKKGWVLCTPPFKSHLEEKLWQGIFHHPALTKEWQTLLGTQHWNTLNHIIPKTWILDASPLPPHAVIPGLAEAIGLDTPIQSFEQLKTLTQKQRELVIKPSGFSPIAWGSKGVTIGHDVSTEDWCTAIDTALNTTDIPPYVLQVFHKPKRNTLKKWLASGQAPLHFEGRTRLCPYYFASPQGKDSKTSPSMTLAGILATSCPADKKIIHGMKDGILSPAQYESHKPPLS